MQLISIMRRPDFSTYWRCFTLAWVVFCFTGQESRAQSFLDRLEKAVKKQLGDSKPPAAEVAGESNSSAKSQTDTLPPPKTNARNKAENPSPVQGDTNGPKLVAPTRPVVPPPSEVRSMPSILEPSDGGAKAPVESTPRGRVYLGLEAEENSLGIGVRVVACSVDSPAWKAGFEIGDQILAINGYAVAKLDDMVAQLGKTSPGETVRFLVKRAGRNKNLNAVLMDADLAGQIGMVNSNSAADAPPYLGVLVNDLTKSFRSQFGINVYRGAAVSSVTAGSPASRAGIQAGDAIVEAGGVPIETAAELMGWVSRTRPGQQVDLLVYRGTISRRVSLVIGIQPRSPLAGVTGRGRTERAPRSAFGESLVTPPSPSAGSGATNRAGAEFEAELNRLRAENEQLKLQLQATREAHAATEAKLDQIMKLLKERN